MIGGKHGFGDPRLKQKLESTSREVREAAAALDAIRESQAYPASESMVRLAGELDEFSHFMKEMAVVEEKMQGIAETGRTLVQRLSSGSRSDGRDGL